MKRHALVFALFALLVGLSVGAAQAGTVPVPVKGVIDAQGSVQLSITFYSRAAGGQELFSVTKTLPVVNHIYFGMVNVPDTVFQGREQVFFETALPAAPALPLGARGQFTNRDPGAPNRAILVQGCSLCFTCGGPFPIFQGAFTNTGSAPQERGSSCSGSVVSRSDTRPYLCCQ